MEYRSWETPCSTLMFAARITFAHFVVYSLMLAEPPERWLTAIRALGSGGIDAHPQE